jgi:hypothetical protein
MACVTVNAPAVGEAMPPTADKLETEETKSDTCAAIKKNDLLESVANANT